MSSAKYLKELYLSMFHLFSRKFYFICAPIWLLTRKIYNNSIAGGVPFEIRIIFLDISKAFHKVWHQRLIFKLKQCGINGALLNWFHDYLSDRLQRVVVEGQSSSCGHIKARVPQGSVLGPLLFLIYINDVTSIIKHCNIRLFADDSCLFYRS